MTFAKLREALLQEPSYSAWMAIREIFEQWEEKKELKKALEYANEHLQDWPDNNRFIKEFKASQKLPKYWPLVRSITQDCGGRGISKVYWKKDFSQITSLYLYQCNKATNLEPLSRCTNLKSFQMNPCYELEDVSEIGELEYLEEVELSFCHARKLKGIGKLQHLRKLVIVESPQIELKELATLKHLEHLDISFRGVGKKDIFLQTREEVKQFQQDVLAKKANTKK